MSSHNTGNLPTQGHGDTFEISTATHDALSAWFMGPKAENSDLLKQHLTDIVDRIARERIAYFRDDPAFITPAAKSSDAYKRETADLARYLTFMTSLLSRYSVPSFSPRYMGHMCFDNSLPATLGYLVAMLHNPNNVAVEASPLTSYVEYCVGQQLCRMLGYPTKEEVRAQGGKPVRTYKGWGHVTCDGSVANLEAMWVARNLKYYPLSLKWAIEEGGLGFIAKSFTIPLTRKDSSPVLFMHASTADLLNLKPEVILDIPDRLSKQFGISQTFLDRVMEKYLVQTMGREPIDRRYRVVKTPKVIVSKMNHYSWPKGAAVLGIGRDNVHQIDIDHNARMDVARLEAELLSLTRAGHPIYAVVAIMGTTEHGAVDPLERILALRSKFQTEHGVSFLVHCDAAWGGYFASLLHPPPPEYKAGRVLDDGGAYVPEQALSTYTETQLRSMRHADSITIDPHKSGYVPYPAGGLCYKDERAKYLITWTGPYIDGGGGDVESMGVYGLEGSKPGAAPVAVYISNEVIGLHRGGYGGLLGEAMFTSVKMYSHWATMTLDSDTLIVAPFNMLPAEREGKAAAEVEEQRRYVRTYITNRPNRELVRDSHAMALVKEMGSDLSINAFACNFRLGTGGPPNRDVAEASFLNARIIARLSIARVDDEARTKPVLLMGTEMEPERYGACLRGFKKRLGLDGDDDGSLAGLCNVSMTPFPTTGNFVCELAEAFRKVAEEEVQNCWKRVKAAPAIHSFVVQGTKDLYLTYLPMFHVGSFRQQLIISAKLPRGSMDAYVKAQKTNPTTVFTAHTSAKELLSTILQKRKCHVDIQQDLPVLHGLAGGAGFKIVNVELSEITVVKHTSLGPRSLTKEYPPLMPFFLYGTANELHIDHILLKSPNMQLSCGSVELHPKGIEKAVDLRNGAIVTFNGMREYAMQPFQRGRHFDYFTPRRTFGIDIYSDPFVGQHGVEPIAVGTLFDKLDLTRPIATGTLTLGNSVYIDNSHINRDTVPELSITPREQLTRDELLLSVSGDYQKIADDIRRVVSHHSALTAPDIGTHILLNASLPGKYALRRTRDDTRELAERSGGQPAVALSRFAMQGPSDEQSRTMAVRKGWKDVFDRALVDHGVRSANGAP